MRDHYADYRVLGADVLAVTTDEPAKTRQLAEEMQLPFAVLSDVGRAVADRYNVLDGDKGIAINSTFILGPAGVIRYRHVGLTPADRPSGADIVAELKRLLAVPTEQPV